MRDMKQKIISFVKYILIFVSAFSLMILLLFVPAHIPQDSIRMKMQETAGIICENPDIYNQIDFLQSSRIDHYADSIWLSIAYYMTDDNPFVRIARADYYDKQGQYAKNDLWQTVYEDVSANTEYIRYWHGPAGLLRFLHLFWNIRQICIFHAVLMTTFYLVLIILLIRNEFRAEAVVFTIAMFVVSAWFVPFCLEYTYSFLCMLVAAVIGVLLCLKRKYIFLDIYFMLVGMVTVYFDFLTTETLTLLVPLLFILRIRNKQGIDNSWKTAIKCSISWSVGYIGMWVAKWAFASIILRQNVLPFVVGHIEERTGGAVSGVPADNYIFTAIIRNLKCLFPFEYGIYGAIVLVVLLAIIVVMPVVLNKVTLKKDIYWKQILLYVALGFLPFVRLAVLHNHAYLHYFFSYRALASSIMALCFIALELIGPTRRKAVTTDA